MSVQAGQLAGQLASELRRADQLKYSQLGIRSLEKLLLTNLVFGHYSVIIRSIWYSVVRKVVNYQFGIRSLESTLAPTFAPSSLLLHFSWLRKATF